MNVPNEGRDSDRIEKEMAWSKALRFQYDGVAQEPLPDRFAELLAQLDDAESRGR